MQGRAENSNNGNDKDCLPRFFAVLQLCLVLAFSMVMFFFNIRLPLAADLPLQVIIDEALRNNPEIRSSEWRLLASRFKIPQTQSLPDPMFMFGYQNEGVRNLYTFGNKTAPDSQWMFSVSQMIPFPGKLSLKGEMAARDLENLQSRHESLKLKTVSKIKELYYSLFFVYKNIDLINERRDLFSKIEDVAETRYKTGTGSLQDLLMAQTEKYMLLEKEEMLRQRIQSLEAMLNFTAGRDVNAPIGKPSVPNATSFNYDLDALLKIVVANSPEINAFEKMLAASHAKLKMAHLEYYPDFVLTASYFTRSATFPDMWSVSAAINIPLFYKTKQRQAVNEGMSMLSKARSELDALKLMVSSSIRDAYSMFKTSGKLMELYKDGIIPKMRQDAELSIAAYIAGKSDALTVLTKIKNIIDFEILYWSQFVEREKAIAKLEELTALKIKELNDSGGAQEGKKQ